MTRRSATIVGLLAVALAAIVAGVIVAGGAGAGEGSASAPPASPPPSPPAATGGPLEIAVEDDAGPWSLADGTGYANDVVRAAFAAAGVAIHLQVVPYARCKQMVIDGEVAACFSMSRRPELDAALQFSTLPLFVCHTDLVLRAGAPTIAGEAALRRGTVVGTTLGYEYPDAVYRLRDAGTIVIEEAVSEELNLKKLADGRLDAALINDNDTKTLASMEGRAGVTGRVASGYRLGELASFIGFSRKHPRGREARDRFDQGLRAISDDGTVHRIEQTWTARVASGAR